MKEEYEFGNINSYRTLQLNVCDEALIQRWL